MEEGKDMSHCAFNKFFKTNVPHILEKIFMYLDYEAFKSCIQVNKTWNDLLKSESMQKKAKSMLFEEITEDEMKLWHASRMGEAWEVKMLLSSSMLDINFADDIHKTTPLIRAAENGHEDVVSCLINNGADPNVADAHGGNPLHMSAQNGHKSVVKLLLDGGADPNRADDYGMTSLLWAVDSDIVRLLLEKGAEVNKADEDGETPLHVSAKEGLTSVVKILLDNGADPSKVDKDALTPLHTAAQEGEAGTVELLLERGADPNKADKDGDTPLHIAAMITNDHDNGFITFDNKEVVQLLLKWGADLNKTNNSGYIPRDFRVVQLILGE